MLREFWDRNQKVIIVAVGILLFLTAGYIATSFPHRAQRPARTNTPAAQLEAASPEAGEKETKAAAIETSETAAAFSNASTTSAADLPSEWILYITGEVRRPGVYKLPANARLLQLVSAAGGLSMTADPTAVNLAAFVEDGMHVHIPGKGDDQPAYTAYIGVTADVTALVEPGRAQPDSPNTGLSQGGLPKSGLLNTGLPVDVNRASADELTALKGIGPALAGRIVEYRLKNGRFHKVEDLLRVRGIGRKTLEQFRDAVVIRP